MWNAASMQRPALRGAANAGRWADSGDAMTSERMTISINKTARLAGEVLQWFDDIEPFASTESATLPSTWTASMLLRSLGGAGGAGVTQVGNSVSSGAPGTAVVGRGPRSAPRGRSDSGLQLGYKAVR